LGPVDREDGQLIGLEDEQEHCLIGARFVLLTWFQQQ
jgi:hypothetical protein